MRLRRGSIDLLRPKESDYDVEAYLAKREEDLKLRVAEFGHGIKPLALYDGSFSGGRSYVGIEAWVRQETLQVGDDDAKELLLRKIVYETPVGYNALFLEINVGSQAEKYKNDIQRLSGERTYVGDYSPETFLVESSVDEVFVGSVFGDPTVADSRKRSQALLAELARVVKPSGVIILRETISPQFFSLTPRQIEKAGLEVKECVLRENEQLWNMLEALYGKSNIMEPKKGFYVFLQKRQKSQES